MSKAKIVQATEPDLPNEDSQRQEDERELLYASIRRLRASHDRLLVAAKEALDAWNHPGIMGTVYSMTRSSASLEAAIAAAEELAP